jgi:hypothetical protein
MALSLVLAAPVVLAPSLLAPSLLAQDLLVPTAAPTAAPVAAPATTPHHKSHKTQTQFALPSLPSGPLSQLPMDQIPPTPARVSYQGGLLTISAQNSTLGEILRDVRKLTGASIEIPPGSGANERVVTHLGPGAPRDVLAGLLNGSSFNYVMVGSSSDPTAVSSVILMAKPSSSGVTQTVANVNVNEGNPGAMPPNGVPPVQPFNRQFIAQQPGNRQPAVGQPAAVEAEADDSKDDDDDSADDADDQAQPGQPGQPGQPAQSDANAQQQQPDPNQPNAGPKTPEQVMELLRQRQQQMGLPGMPPPQPPQQ